MTSDLHLTLKPNSAPRKTSPYLFGQFIEHMGNCIYDGIWVGEDSPIPNDSGLRLDTIRALQRLEIPVLRWPGGLWADIHHWRDGIGPHDKRPVRQNLGWNTLENNQFGTHEFMRLCELTGAEPYLCLNLGTGLAADAKGWFEYCNGAGDTPLTRERANNGHSQPFEVKFWNLGNDLGDYWKGSTRPAQSTPRSKTVNAGNNQTTMLQTALETIPDLDASGIKLIFSDAVSAPGAEPWNSTGFDLIAVPVYTSGPFTTLPEERYSRILSSLQKARRRIREICHLSEVLSTTGHSVQVSIDEWGIWQNEATLLNGLTQSATFGDALFAAAFLHLLFENDRVVMANLGHTINALQALILTQGPQFCLTPTYHVFDMLKIHRGAERLELESKPRTASNGTQPTVSALATRGTNGKITISLVNLDLQNRQTVTCAVDGGVLPGCSGQILSGNLNAANTFAEPEAITPQQLDVIQVCSGSVTIQLPPASVVILQFGK